MIPSSSSPLSPHFPQIINTNPTNQLLSIPLMSTPPPPPTTTATSSLPPHNTKQEDSEEEDLFTVPDVESGPSSSGKVQGGAETSSGHAEGPSRNRRGRNPADREYRRLKRLLRNRVSAQQARERKKVYANDLEKRAEELQDRNLKLEEKISTLINENTMLRKVLVNTRPKADKSLDRQNDQPGNS